MREFTDGPMDDPALVEAVGAASRDLLEWCWSAEIQDRFYTHIAILGVIATYGSDPGRPILFFAGSSLTITSKPSVTSKSLHSPESCDHSLAKHPR